MSRTILIKRIQNEMVVRNDTDWALAYDLTKTLYDSSRLNAEFKRLTFCELQTYIERRIKEIKKETKLRLGGK